MQGFGNCSKSLGSCSEQVTPTSPASFLPCHLLSPDRRQTWKRPKWPTIKLRGGHMHFTMVVLPHSFKMFLRKCWKSLSAASWQHGGAQALAWASCGEGSQQPPAPPGVPPSLLTSGGMRLIFDGQDPVHSVGLGQFLPHALHPLSCYCSLTPRTGILIFITRLVFFFETRSTWFRLTLNYVAQAGLTLARIFLPQPVSAYDYRCVKYCTINGWGGYLHLS